MVLLLSSLGLHLLHLNGVGLSPPHVQLMVAHAQSQYALVDAQTWGIKYKILQRADAFNPPSDKFSIYDLKEQTYGCFFVYGFYDKLLIVERDVSNFTPREANLWCQPKKIQKKIVENMN